MRHTFWLAGMAIAVFAGCSDNNEPTNNGNGGGTTPNATVSVQNNSFNPSATNITTGQTVRWTWNSGGIQHNVTFDAGPPNSPTQGSGSFDRTFSDAGTFNYHCTIHGVSMSGSVVVGTSSDVGGNPGGDGGNDPGY